MHTKFGATFPFFEKIEVNGPNTHELYKYLRTNCHLYDAESKTAKEIPWNFSKFLVKADSGQVLGFYGSETDPIAIIPRILREID